MELDQVTRLNDLQTKTQNQIKALGKRSQKRLIRSGILLANLIMLVGVTAFVLRTPASRPAGAANSVLSTEQTGATNVLDQVSSADIAVNVAKLVSLPEVDSVTNKADTVNAQLSITAADNTVIAKPQVVATELKSYKDIVEYVTVEGDTIPSVAAKFGVTSDSIRWSNGLQGDNVEVGKSLLVPPVNGVAYVVKAGDTVDSIIAKYRANKDQFVADNDTEILGLRVGSKVLIRDGSVAPVVTRTYTRTPSAVGFAWGSGAIYGYNGYDRGYCTWYAANRRAAAGRPIPANLGNASTWVIRARAAGIPTGNVPQAGAVIWTPPRDYYGHVGYVESVNADGSVNVSEMNVVGWNRVSTRTLSAAEASRYSYIY